MLIGDRLRAIREEKKLSQGDIEKRTGLFRCYVSRVENGHTVPAVETIEKFARALEVPIYYLFYAAVFPFGRFGSWGGFSPSTPAPSGIFALKSYPRGLCLDEVQPLAVGRFVEKTHL